MKHIWIILASVCLQCTQGENLHFPMDTVTTHACENQQSLPATIESFEAVGGALPITYSVSGYKDYFSIEATTGVISIVKDISNVTSSNFVIYKRAHDNGGSTAEMKIYLTVAQVHSFKLVCPKIIQLNVRETAPIGEEVGKIECTAMVKQDIFQMKKPVVAAVSKGNYLPFETTKNGIIVVSAPLAFRNSIADIFIMNVVVEDIMLDAGNASCNKTETHIAVRITVEKSDCPSNWTYDLNKNKNLDVPALTSLSSSTMSQCMSACTHSTPTPCNSFVYNVVKKQCTMFNETDYTEPNMVRQRMGYFLYRKQCKTDTLPNFALRNVNQKLQASSTLSPNQSTCVLEDLLTSVKSIANMTYTNTLLAANIMHDIAENTTTANTTQEEITGYIYVFGQVVDFLQESMASLDGVMVTRKTFNVMVSTFDFFMESLSDGLSEELSNIDVTSNTTSVKTTIVNVDNSPNKVSISVDDYESSVSLSSCCEKDRDILNVTILLGVFDGVGRWISPRLADESIRLSDTPRTYKLVGHLLSVILKPALNISSPVQLDIHTTGISDYMSDRVCVFLQRHGNSKHDIVWSTQGCWLAGYNNTHTICQCTHLTNFAVLMQVHEFVVSAGHIASLEVITVIGCCVSIAALSTTLAIILWLRLLTERYVLLLHLSVAIILAQVVFLTGVDAVKFKVVCRLVAILLHYLYLAVFTLMLAEGIHLYHKLHTAFCMNDNFTMFLILGWGSPFAIVSISLLTDVNGYGTDQHCWLSTDGAIWAFVGPALTIIAINMAILIMIIRTFLGVKINARKTDSEKFKASVKATVILLPLLGITWMFGIVAVNNSTVVFQYIFALLNSLQGLFIFLFHVVFNEEVRRSCSRYRRRVVTLTSNGDAVPQRSQPNHEFLNKGIVYRKTSSTRF